MNARSRCKRSGRIQYADRWESDLLNWRNSQIEDADTPSEEWVDFFIEKLLSGIAEDGSYGMPICSFVNNSTDLTVVPSLDSKLMAGNDD